MLEKYIAVKRVSASVEMDKYCEICKTKIHDFELAHKIRYELREEGHKKIIVTHAYVCVPKDKDGVSVKEHIPEPPKQRFYSLEEVEENCKKRNFPLMIVDILRRQRASGMTFEFPSRIWVKDIAYSFTIDGALIPDDEPEITSVVRDDIEHKEYYQIEHIDYEYDKAERPEAYASGFWKHYDPSSN